VHTTFLLLIFIEQATEGEMGSPVDLAKSYMRERPPWASPSTNHIPLQSPPSMGKELFVEATPFSVSGKSLCQSKVSFGSLFYSSPFICIVIDPFIAFVVVIVKNDLVNFKGCFVTILT
jgi:hypothetical protein